MTSPKTILLTGGCGFIGSALVRELIQNTEHTVINVDALTYAATPTAVEMVADNPRYRFEQINICDREALSTLIQETQPDAIFHLAAESHVDRSIDGPLTFVETNLLGTACVLEAARNYWQDLETAQKENFRLIHISTDEVFGSLGDTGLFTEETPYDPRSPYAASKAGSDHLARAWQNTYGLPVLITNCSNNYGPYQFPEKLIPLMVSKALAGDDLPVYGDGQQIRDWIHVEDHVRGLLTVWQKGTPGETYNLGAAQESTNLNLVQTLCKVLDSRQPKETGSYADQITFVTDRPGHDRRYAIDSTKALKELGWKAEQTLETGLTHTIDWYLTNQNWWQPLLTEHNANARIGLNPTKKVANS